jgi:hypothetical protein
MSPAKAAWRVATLALVGLALTVPSQGAVETSPVWRPQPGEAFPDLRLPTLDGGVASIADYRGRKVLLHVFASW